MNTEIIIPVPELKTALPGLNKIVGRRTTLPVLSCVKISRSNDGQVSLQATDLDAHATYTLANPQPGQVVDVLVPLEQLNKAFKCSRSDETVAVVCEDKSTKLRYYIGGGPVQQPVNSIPVAEWPPCPEITVESTPLQPGFGQALREAMQCCSQDETRHILRGACLDGSNDKAHYVVATNGRFLYSANSFTFPFKTDIIVPDSKFINGSLLDAEPCRLAVQPAPVKPTKSGSKPAVDSVRHLCFQSKQWRFVTREIPGNYPNWRQVIPAIDSGWTIIRLQQPAIDQLLKVIPHLPGADIFDSAIKLRTGDKCLWVEGKNKDDKDWTSIAISDVSITGKPKQIRVNREYLLPALKFGLCELAIETELTPMVCTKGGKRMVIMPLNPYGPNATKATETPKPETSTPSAATPPPTAEVQNTADERKTDMPKETAKTETTTTEAATVDSPFKLAMTQVDAIREALKNVLRDLASVVDTLKVAERENKATNKEIDQFRDKLREIQGIKI